MGWYSTTDTLFFGNHNFSTEVLNIDATKLGSIADEYKIGDFNGDGAADFFTYNYPQWAISATFVFHPLENRHVISQVTNGLGSAIQVNYLSLTNPMMYISGNSTYSYPYIKKALAIRMVSSAYQDNGITSIGNNTSYRYQGLKYHV